MSDGKKKIHKKERVFTLVMNGIILKSTALLYIRQKYLTSFYDLVTVLSG